MKKVISLLTVLIMSVVVFAQSAEYTKYLEQAKEYEEQKKWCHALESYFDAMGTDDEPELKDEAYNRFTSLKETIEQGNPGYVEPNPFDFHDEWIKLLIDAEQVGSSFNRYELMLGKLELDRLEYTTRTACYSAEITDKDSERYKHTLKIIQNGYQKAYRRDWSYELRELEGWPLYSISSTIKEGNNIDGALVFKYSENKYNSFALPDRYKKNLFYEYKINLIDNDGNELVEGKNFLIGESRKIIFNGLTQDIMELIESGKVNLNLVKTYLKYGEIIGIDENDLNNLPGIELPAEKNAIIYWNGTVNLEAVRGKRVTNLFLNNICKMVPVNTESVTITGDQSSGVFIRGRTVTLSPYSIGKYQVTQELYKSVMGTNPSYFSSNPADGETQKLRPVEYINWYRAIAFCNRLSIEEGLEPCYSVKDAEGNEIDWARLAFSAIPADYYDERNVLWDAVVCDMNKNGYRLPTEAEWEFAARGGDQSAADWNFRYAGSKTNDEVAWYEYNAGDKTHEVGKKKPNRLGLYDMSGNVWEWCWDWYDSVNSSETVTDPTGAASGSSRVRRGGSYDIRSYFCAVEYRDDGYPCKCNVNYGFRLVRSSSK